MCVFIGNAGASEGDINGTALFVGWLTVCPPLAEVYDIDSYLDHDGDFGKAIGVRDFCMQIWNGWMYHRCVVRPEGFDTRNPSPTFPTSFAALQLSEQLSIWKNPHQLIITMRQQQLM